MELFLVFLLLCSAMFAGSETALLAMGRIALKRLKGEHPHLYGSLAKILSKPQELIIGILLGNEITNIAVTLTISSLIIHYFSFLDPTIVAGLNVIFSTVLLVWLGEITPKIIAAQNPTGFLRIFLPGFKFFLMITQPIRYILSRFMAIAVPPAQMQDRFDENDLRGLLEEGGAAGMIPELQSSLIESTLLLDDLVALSSMTKKEDVTYICENSSISDALEKFKKSSYTRLPVYDLVKKEPIGLIRFKDFLKFLNQPLQWSESVQLHISAPLFVSSKFTLDRILMFFRSHKSHMAFVLSPKGEYLGLITMDDVIRKLTEFKR